MKITTYSWGGGNPFHSLLNVYYVDFWMSNAGTNTSTG